MVRRTPVKTLPKSSRSGSILSVVQRCMNGTDLNLNSLLVKRQIDNPSPGAVTGGN